MNRWLLFSCLALATGCGDTEDDIPSGEGSLSVLLEAEETITEGLDPGMGGENIVDGWQVRFGTYLVAIGDVDLTFATDPTLSTEAPEVFIADLATVPASGLELWSFEGLNEGRWNVSYRTAPEGAVGHESATTEDVEAMTTNDWTYLIRGTISRDDGVSCPPASKAMVPMAAVESGSNGGGDTCYANPSVTFAFGVDAETTFGPCEIDGNPGVSVTAGAPQSATLTIHGDHIFFNGFPEGDEGGIARYAQWLADCDLNLDGEVTREELEALAPADLYELDSDRFQLDSPPITPLDSMWTYVRAQLKTQGHFQGEGECAVDGIEHDHGHEGEHDHEGEK